MIDLRNNPGGVLDAAVQIADDFLDHGTIVSAIGRTSDANFRMEAKPGDITHGARLVLLVNGGSASASEILAAALHDNGRATADRTAHLWQGLGADHHAAVGWHGVKMTTSRYFTPRASRSMASASCPMWCWRGRSAPADLDATDDDTNADGSGGTLLQRDPQVALALQQFGPHEHLIAQHATPSTAA